MSGEVNGIAHIQLNVINIENCLPFWERFCYFLELKTLMKSDDMVYCKGSRAGLLVRQAPEGKRDQAFDQDRPGLHHICFCARNNEDVDAIHDFVRDKLGGKTVRPPEEGPWVPGYYSILFEDPDGLHVEVNFVPGKGHLKDERAKGK